MADASWELALFRLVERTLWSILTIGLRHLGQSAAGHHCRRVEFIERVQQRRLVTAGVFETMASECSLSVVWNCDGARLLLLCLVDSSLTVHLLELAKEVIDYSLVAWLVGLDRVSIWR